MLRASRGRVVMLCVTVLVIATMSPVSRRSGSMNGCSGRNCFRPRGSRLRRSPRRHRRRSTWAWSPASFVGMDEFMADALKPHRGLLYAAMLDDGWKVIAATEAARSGTCCRRVPPGLACSAGALTVMEPVQAIVIPCVGGRPVEPPAGAVRWPRPSWSPTIPPSSSRVRGAGARRRDGASDRPAARVRDPARPDHAEHRRAA